MAAWLEGHQLLNSRERVLKALNLQQPDRVPVVPFVISFAAKYAGLKFIEYCKDADKLAKAQAVTAERFNIDAVYVDSDAVIDIEAMGAEVSYFDDEVPTASRPIVGSLDDVRRLEVPDPQRDGRLPVWLDAIKILRSEVGERLAVFSNINGPFQIAAQLRGITKICMDFYRNPELVLELVDLATHASIAMAKAEVEAGTDAVVLGDAMSSPNLISPKQFEQFSFPYIRRIIEEVGHSIPFFLHICGDSTRIIDKMVETGTRFLEVDAPVDLQAIGERYGKSVGVRGNISPTLLLNGQPHQVEESCHKSIEAATKLGGFILGSGCELPKNTPHANLVTMVRSADKYGKYA
jgi:uroporphyrinogen decarboxylase